MPDETGEVAKREVAKAEVTKAELAKAEVAKYEALADKAYGDMYDSRTPAACYSDLKDYFASAIGAAERAGLHDEAARLDAKLEHCRQVYRSQFSSF
jgi:hypothetical protein